MHKKPAKKSKTRSRKVNVHIELTDAQLKKLKGGAVTYWQNKTEQLDIK